MRFVSLSVPDQERLTQAGTRGNDGDGAAGFGGLVVQCVYVVRLQQRYGIGYGFQVVEQRDALQAQGICQARFLHFPR